MAQRVSKSNNKKGKTQAAQSLQSGNENTLWIFGFVVLVIGIFGTVSTLSHYFNWASDLSALNNDESLTGVVVPFENICNGAGARVAYWLVDCSFGIFGIIIPIVLTIIGWRMIRKQQLHLNHFALSAALLLIMGSLTMGLVASKMELPYDLGGELGQACAKDLDSAMGLFGTLLVMLVGWILTGVFINRNFIKVVNRASDTMVNQGERIVSAVKDKVVLRKGGEPQQDDEVEDNPEVSEGQDSEPDLTANISPAPQKVVDDGLQNTPYHVTKPASQVEPDFRSAQMSVNGEKPLTMNDYLAQKREDQIGNPTVESEFADSDFVKDDTQFYVKDMNPQLVEEPKEEIATAQMDDGAYEDENGFIVRPNPGATINPINVGVLLGNEQSQPPKPQRESLVVGDCEFTVVDRNYQTQDAPQAESPAEQDNVTPEPKPQVHVVDGVEFVVSDSPNTQPSDPKPQQSLVSEVDDAELEGDGLVVTVHEHKPRQMEESEIDNTLYDPLRDLENYDKPYVSLLEDYKSPHKVSDAEIYDNKYRITQTLKNFGIPISDISATVGPTVTLYEIVQAQGVKISKVQGLEKDIAQSLRALGIRIIAPIPGRGTIGIEVPNRDKQIVSMYSSICSEEFQHSKAELPVVIGRTIQNENYTFDLAKMPHLLVAGATGQGKSVGLNAIITSLLFSKHPAELKFVMIDPKQVEFSIYNKLERHFLAKMESEDEAIVTDPKKAVYVLNSLVEEMGQRLELCKKATARNIVEYNEKFTARRLNPRNGHRFLPYIVVIVDEFADLIMTAKEVEVPVMRLAQKARAVGIHLIIATQRPDVKIITGGIKANFPARIAFRVMQMIDSRTIIDQPGANQLIGRGDMLFSKDGELTRIQCALVETKEVERLVDFISKQQGYSDAYPLPDYTPESGDGGAGAMGDMESGAPVKYDVLFGEVARAAVTNGIISTSGIQRTYEVGFNRAGRIMLQLERAGIVGPQVGAKPREIKYYDLPSLEAKLQELGVF